MCFYGESDWTASVYTDDVLPAPEPVRCDECRRMIPPGAFRRHIFMEEHDECRHNPMHWDYDGPDTDSEECPPGCQHDFGENFEYDRCEACDQIIEAIHRHEIAEGCDDDESRPNLTELGAAMSRGDGRAYLAKAEELYPGITARLPADFLRFRERKVEA